MKLFLIRIFSRNLFFSFNNLLIFLKEPFLLLFNSKENKLNLYSDSHFRFQPQNSPLTIYYKLQLFQEKNYFFFLNSKNYSYSTLIY